MVSINSEETMFQKRRIVVFIFFLNLWHYSVHPIFDKTDSIDQFPHGIEHQPNSFRVEANYVFQKKSLR